MPVKPANLNTFLGVKFKACVCALMWKSHMGLVLKELFHNGTPRTPSAAAWGMRYTARTLLLKEFPVMTG